MLDGRDDRLDDHRVRGRLRGITNVLQIFDVGRIECGDIGGLGRGSHVVRMRAQNRKATDNFLGGSRAKGGGGRVQMITNRVDRNVTHGAGNGFVGLVR